MRSLIAILLVGALFGANPALANSVRIRPRPQTTTSADFSWPRSKPSSAKTLRYRKLVREADAWAIRAAHELGRYPTRARRKSWARRAVGLYERAIAMRSKGPVADLHYRAAEILFSHFLDGRAYYVRTPEAAAALKHWAAFERLKPLDPRMERVLASRALVHTKRHEFRLAIRDYELLLRRSAPSSLINDEAARRLGNLAEIHMMTGALRPALKYYQAAMHYGPTPSWAFGWAVALDRDGQGRKARELLRIYATPRAIQRFDRDVTGGSTFFVPAGEEHYYRAMLYEAQGDKARAIAAYRSFVVSGAHPKFHARARDNIRMLKQAMAKNQPSKSRRGLEGGLPNDR